VPNEHKCRARRKDGSACTAPANLIGDDGFCWAHSPGNRQALLEAAEKGGAATAKRLQRNQGGIDPAELGDNETVEDVRRWVRVIGQAVASGRLGHKEATAALRACEVSAKMVQTATREELADLRAAIRRAEKVKAVR